MLLGQTDESVVSKWLPMQTGVAAPCSLLLLHCLNNLSVTQFGGGTSYACQFVDTMDRNPKNHHVLDTPPVGLTYLKILSIICCFSLFDKNIQSVISGSVLPHPRQIVLLAAYLQTPVQGLSTSKPYSNSIGLTGDIAMGYSFPFSKSFNTAFNSSIVALFFKTFALFEITLTLPFM